MAVSHLCGHILQGLKTNCTTAVPLGGAGESVFVGGKSFIKVARELHFVIQP